MNKTRIMVENKIVQFLATSLRSRGYLLFVVDEDTGEHIPCDTGEALLREARTFDIAYVITLKGDLRSFVTLIFGNGSDIVSDYDMSLQEVLTPVLDFAESYS